MKRRRRPVLRWLLGIVVVLVVLVLGAALAATLLVDPNGFKPIIEAQAARATGGTLALRGPIRVGFGLPARLAADDIAFTGDGGRMQAHIAQVSARVALLPLLTGAVDIVRLDLTQPRLTLLEAPAAPAAAAPAAPPASQGSKGGRMLRLAIGAVHLRDGQVTWHGTTFAVPQFDAVAESPGADFLLSGTVRSAGRPLALTGETGPAAALLGPAGTAPWPVQVVLQGDGVRLAVRGTLAAPVPRAGYALQVDAAATDLTALAPLLPKPLPALHDVSVSAHLAGAGAAAPQISALTVHAAGLDLGAAVPGLMLTRADITAPDLRQPAHADVQATLHGTAVHVLATAGPLAGTALPLTVTVDTPPLVQARAVVMVGWAPRPSVRGTVTMQRLDLDALLAALPAQPKPEAAASPAASPAGPAARPARMISDRPIDFAMLRRADADLAVSVAALQAGGVVYSDVAGHLVLQGGRLTLDPFAAKSPGGPLQGRLAIDASVPAPPVAVTLHAPGLSLAPLATALGHPGALTGTAAVDADLKAAGASPHALAASLDGHLALMATNADVDDVLLAAMLGEVVRAARLPANALGRAGRTKVRCLDLRLAAHDGTVTAATLFADTPTLLVQGTGAVDLKTEALNLRLRPMLRVGPGVVVPVHVGGTLSDPKAAIEPGKAARTTLLGTLEKALTGGHHQAVPAEPCAPAG